jgi:hypothetical protein
MDTPLVDIVIRDHTKKLAELKRICCLEKKLIRELQQLESSGEDEDWCCVPTSEADEEWRCMHMDRCTQRDRAIARARRFGLPTSSEEHQQRSPEMYKVMSVEEHRLQHPEMYSPGPEMYKVMSVEEHRLQHPEMYPPGPKMCSIEAERLKELLDIELDHYMQNK